MDPTDPSALNDDRIWSILEDNSGIIWIGGFSGGLNKFDKNTDLFTRIRISDSYSSDNTNFIYGITSDSTNIYVNQPPMLSILTGNNVLGAMT